MSITGQRKVINEHDNSKIALGFLAVMVVFGLFVVGYDQGHIFSIVQGSGAFYMKYFTNLLMILDMHLAFLATNIFC